MDEKPKSNGVISIAFTILILVVAYPLSIGPYVWFRDRGYLSDSVDGVVSVAYVPLAYVVLTIPGAAELAELYASFWEP